MTITATIQNIALIAGAVYLTMNGHWGMAIVLIIVLGLMPKSKDKDD